MHTGAVGYQFTEPGPKAMQVLIGDPIRSYPRLHWCVALSSSRALAGTVTTPSVILAGAGQGISEEIVRQLIRDRDKGQGNLDMFYFCEVCRY